MAYDEYVKQTLAQNHLFRHLFARPNQEVIIETGDAHIRGILKTIDLSNNFLEIEAVEPVRKTFFVNLRKCIYVETENKVLS